MCGRYELVDGQRGFTRFRATSKVPAIPSDVDEWVDPEAEHIYVILDHLRPSERPPRHRCSSLRLVLPRHILGPYATEVCWTAAS